MKHQTCTTAVGEAAYRVGVMSHRFDITPETLAWSQTSKLSNAPLPADVPHVFEYLHIPGKLVFLVFL